MGSDMTTTLTNELFVEAVDDLIIKTYEAAKSSGTDEQRAHLKAAVRRVEDSIEEIGAILSALELDESA